jgi:hypothetical protein
LPNSYDQKLTLDYFIEILKQNALQEPEQPVPEPKNTTMTFQKLTEGLRVIETGIKMLEDGDSKGHRAAKTRQGIRMLACYEEILKEKKRKLSHHNSLPNF